MFWVRLLVGILCGAVVGFIVIATWSYGLKWLYNPDTKRLFESLMVELEDLNKWTMSEDFHYAYHNSGVILWWWKQDAFNIDVYQRSDGKLHVGFTVQQKWKIHRRLKKIKQRIVARAAKSEFGMYGSAANVVAAQILQHNLTGVKAEYKELLKEGKDGEE